MVGDGEQKVGGGRDTQSERFSQGYQELEITPDEAVEFPTKIEKSDIKPHAIGLGETEIVVQRHGKYIRDREDAQVGSLSQESADEERAAAQKYFQEFLAQLPEEERDTVDVLFVSSDTQYFDGGRRSYETAELAQAAAEQVLQDNGISTDHILNHSHDLMGDGKPRPWKVLREPQMFDKSPDFVDYMVDKYGPLTQDFWIAYEEDTEKEKRLEMGAEGPDEIADRLSFALRVLSRYSGAYHKSNPDRRLVVWASTHYDTISPFVKRDVFETGKEQQLLVDYGAGITVDIDKEGRGTTVLGGKDYEVPLRRKKKEGTPE